VEVIELAAINMKGKLVYEGLFKPRHKIPRRVIEIHGITNEQVKSSRTFSQRAEGVAPLCTAEQLSRSMPDSTAK